MHTVNLHEAKTQLSALVEEVLKGEEVIIARAGKPVVRLVPFQETKAPRRPGRLEGLIHFGEDFDAIDEEVAGLFEGGA
jgi:prevent-host-death family protein